MNEPTPESIAYDLCNRVDAPGWGDEVQAAIADAIRQAEIRAMEAALQIVTADCPHSVNPIADAIRARITKLKEKHDPRRL